jgi:serine/threonine-protein kinase
VAPAFVEEAYVESPPPREDERLRWPWVLLISLLVVAAIIGALLATGTIGGKKVVVPKVVGINQAAAATVLHRAGLEVSFDAVQSDKPKGFVISQDVNPGTRVKEGTTIHASVSAGPGDTQIPPVDGLTRTAARKALDEAGFNIRERHENDSEVKENHVIRTQPEAGTTLEIGSEVVMVVSDGPPDVDVPGVIGKQLDEARAALEEAGFEIATVDKETLDEEPGTVLAQDPADGQAPEGSTVTLTIAREPETIQVPDVVDETDSDAIRILQDAGFKVAPERQDVEDLEQDGIVLEQDPEGDSDAKPGDTVTIVVGRFNPDLNPEGTDTTATTPEVVPPADEGARR